MNAIQLDEDKALQTAKEKAVAILIDSDVTLQESLAELQRARELASKAGLSVDSCIVKPPSEAANVEGPPIEGGPAGTGGHSNTDHVVVMTGDDKLDRIAELKRNLLRRHRAMQPEQRGDERWDKPKIPGERRRRIVREQDKEEYPSEPPVTGWYVEWALQSKDSLFECFSISPLLFHLCCYKFLGMYSFVK